MASRGLDDTRCWACNTKLKEGRCTDKSCSESIRPIEKSIGVDGRDNGVGSGEFQGRNRKFGGERG